MQDNPIRTPNDPPISEKIDMPVEKVKKGIE